MNSSWSYSPEIPCDLEIWYMTLNNNRVPLLCFFKLYESLCSHQWIQTGVRQRTSWVKIDDFMSRVTLKFDGWPWKNNRAYLLLYLKLCASFRSHLWIQTGVMVWKHRNWGKICFDLCDLDLRPLTLTFSMDISSLNGNNSWKFQDDTIVKKVWGKEGQT